MWCTARNDSLNVGNQLVAQLAITEIKKNQTKIRKKIHATHLIKNKTMFVFMLHGKIVKTAHHDFTCLFVYIFT